MSLGKCIPRPILNSRGFTIQAFSPWSSSNLSHVTSSSHMIVLIMWHRRIIRKIIWNWIPKVLFSTKSITQSVCHGNISRIWEAGISRVWLRSPGIGTARLHLKSRSVPLARIRLWRNWLMMKSVIPSRLYSSLTVEVGVSRGVWQRHCMWWCRRWRGIVEVSIEFSQSLKTTTALILKFSMMEKNIWSSVICIKK